MKKNLLLAATLILLFSCNASPPHITLALLGDLMLGRDVQAESDSLAFLGSELKAADVALANLESPLSKNPSAVGTTIGFNLCAPADRASLLAAWSMDLLSLANNHYLDCGMGGVALTKDILHEAGLVSVGPGPDAVNWQAGSSRLAFLAFEDVSTRLDENAAASAIHSARTHADALVVLVHWGMEYQGGPSDRQKVLAWQFANAGADLIVGTHPHVLQPAEWIRTARGKTLVLFSLGNAMFDQGGLADTRQSALIVVTLDSQGVKSARAVPFKIDASRSLITQPDRQTAKQIRDRINLP